MSTSLTPELEAFIAAHLVDRTNTNSLKWDALQERFGNPDLLPLWVADSEFKTPQAVRTALQKQVEHGVFGYSIAPEHYFDTFNNWQRHRHHIDLKPEWLRFDTGVVNSIYAMVNWLTKPGDAVLIMEPVYYPFINAIKDNNRELVSVDLKLMQEGWQIDFEKFEATVRTGKIKLFILCSPHNPVGRIWSEQELDHILDICRRYGVRVVADEIHQDFEVGTQKFQSVLTVAGDKYQDDVIVLNAPIENF